MRISSQFNSLVVLLIVIFGCSSIRAQESEKVSRFGEYSGYSSQRFKEWICESRYIEMRDGVKLAIDIVRPAVDGEMTDEKLPAIWTHSRYHRSPQAIIKQFGGNSDAVKSMVDGSPDLQRLVRHGYVICAVGVRGSGASFGRYEGLFSPNETRDAYEITQWLAEQPWCDGNIGMHGGSYLGITQYMAASQAPPALKAIFPNVAGFDMYDVVYPGGVYREDMVQHWGQLTRQLDVEWKAPQVHTDTDGKMLEQAIDQHQDNWNVIKQYRAARFRDSVADGYSFQTHNPAPFLTQINQASVPAYHWCGWYDIFATDAMLWYANYNGPQKLGMGAWPHANTPNGRLMMERMKLLSIEQHRWFDYWLKGIDNGIMDEPAINYAQMDEEKTWKWASAENWPVEDANQVVFYFDGAKSGTVKSTNDGSLALKEPTSEDARDEYVVDLTTTTGSSSRWDNAVGAGTMIYPDMTANDEKCLTYTSAELAYDLTVTGFPTVTLYASSTADDGDFYVLLEEVDDEGKSHYVTEGILRASHGNTMNAPWNNLDLPYQRSFASDKQKISPGETVQLELDLIPTSTIFNKGHRVRVSIMCADADNTETPPVPDGTKITIDRSATYASKIVLPTEKSE